MPFFLLSILMLCTTKAYFPDQTDSLINITYVNSYHQGYLPSDNNLKGFIQAFDVENVKINFIYMDTKNYVDPDYADSVGKKIIEDLLKEKPDFLVISDDPAMKYVAMPFSDVSNIPILFSGVNWSIEEYDIEGKNITGVLEYLPVEQFVNYFKRTEGSNQKVAVLTENSFSEVKSSRFIKEILIAEGYEVDYFFVSDFAEWASTFMALNDSGVMICLPTNGAIKNWDKSNALDLVSTYTKVPTFTFDSFMMDYATIGFIKNEEEMGRQIAEIIKSILKGKSIKEIPISRNYEYEILTNNTLSTSSN
jgi:ABC-type uncharacterized transport system substrate-binding protein